MEIIRFTASWCQPCQQLSEWLDEKGLNANVSNVVDIDDKPDLVSEYNIRSVPTLIKVDNGAVVQSLSGFDHNMIDKLKGFFDV